MFQMFNQQLDVVSASSRGALLRDVVFECVDAIAEFQNNWLKVLDSEFAKFEKESKDLEEGFPEYVMALANDCYRSTEFSDAMCRRVLLCLKFLVGDYDGGRALSQRVYRKGQREL